MLFNSIDFLIFFPVVVLIYFILPSKIKYLWLLASSYYFYMCWNAKYALLLLFSTVITFISGLLIGRLEIMKTDSAKCTRMKKLCVASSFIINLGVLFLFKYFNFMIENVNYVLSYFHIEIIDNKFSLLLPVGISFYTFQALSYTMDVYRKEIPAEKNFLRYALFVSFFPQLVAGPIERSKNLLIQIRTDHKFDYDRMKQGLLIMLWGYFQKLVISDRIAVFVDTVFDNPAAYEGVYCALASIFFALQIYCDFSGYSLIAVGAAKIMGFSLMDNFNCPYFQPTVADFWRNWHISLTSWFRDYLYIPLGGSRKGTIRKYCNLLIVFLTSGLWHGAQWTYVIWGGLNGLFQIIGSILMPMRKKLALVFRLGTDSIGHRLLKIFVTFILVDFTWIFFRASSVSNAFTIIKSILHIHNYWILFDGSLYQLGLSQKQFWLMIFAIGILLLADWLKYRKVNVLELIDRQDLWCRWVIYLTGIFFVLIFGVWGAGYDAQAFIYFQF